MIFLVNQLQIHKCRQKYHCDAEWEILTPLIPEAKPGGIQERLICFQKRVQVLWVDGGYREDKFALAVWLMIQARVEVIQRDGPEFAILPKRWMVERACR